MVLLAGWAVGTVWLARQRTEGSGFRLQWQQELPEGGNLSVGTNGGLFVSYGDYYNRSSSRIARLDSDGKQLWTISETLDSYRSQIIDEADRTILTTADNRLLAVDNAGELIWECDPDSSRYREYLPGDDEPSASEYFLRRGVLLYGVSTDGEVVWAVNCGTTTISYRTPGYMEYMGGPCYLIVDGQYPGLIDRFGKARQLKPEESKETDSPENNTTIHAGQPGMANVPGYASISAQLLAVLPDGGLLFLSGDNLQVLKDGETFTTDVELDTRRNHFYYMHNESAVSSNERGFLFMVDDQESRYIFLGEDYKEKWEYTPAEFRVSRTVANGSDFVLMGNAPDVLTQSLEKTRDMLPAFLRNRGQSGAAAIQQMPSNLLLSGTAELRLLRDGKEAGRLPLGLSNMMNHWQLTGDGSQLYVRNSNRLSCYVPEGEL